MRKTNALQLRRAAGEVLRQIRHDGRPVLVERNREPVAVLISLRDFHERFVDVVAAEERQKLAEEILALHGRARRKGRSAVDLVREARGPLP